MIRLFRRNKNDINSIQIPDFDWNLNENNKHIKQWVNSEQTMALSINYFDIKPDLSTIKNVENLRKGYREQIASVNGGIIVADVIKLNGFDVVKTIFKIPQDPTGVTYIGSFTIPFENCSYVVKIQAPEYSPTGMRDSVVGMELLNQDQISVGENGYEGWAKDPYDADFKKGSLMNLSEDKKYDQKFPNHPLTQLRIHMDKLSKGLTFKQELENLKKFNK